MKRNRRGAAIGLTAVFAACSSPTAFDAVRDIRMMVMEVVEVSTTDQFHQLDLILRIENKGNLTVSHLTDCYFGRLVRDGQELFDFGQFFGTAESIDIEPGEYADVPVTVGASRAEWDEAIDGEYALGLCLFVQGRSRCKFVDSDPFRIEWGS